MTLVARDWSPKDPVGLKRRRRCAGDVWIGGALSLGDSPTKGAGKTTDDPHHPARALPANVYTICGVFAFIKRYILGLFMKKARRISGPDDGDWRRKA